jgi:ethanolamine phosphate phosphodiesterase
MNHPTPELSTDILTRLRYRVLRISTLVALVWLVAVWWGERGIFHSAVAQCDWSNWERWVETAEPHHVLLVADPQLVDPHTYPDRPWPLSSLTILYTDLYLKRAYYNLQHALVPDSTLFLGDLFDGGREWGVAKYKSKDQIYQKYGQDFWKNEYYRFSGIFFRSWAKQPKFSTTMPYGRKILASVPGNHDLGFASGIEPVVKNRFDAYFGPLNRVDVLGNHSFVSLDTVSLSAMDQVDPETGAHGGGDATAAATASSHLWRPVEDFLSAAKVLRHKAVQHEWRSLINAPHVNIFQPEVVALDAASDGDSIVKVKTAEVPTSQFPSIVLSHVPLFRAADTPCGPQREGRPSISLSKGYQYQNVLTPLISADIIKHLTPEEVIHIYSGDDHDFCEVAHVEYTGAIKEITVKSMSWAMGIRKPGVQLLSLWNPIDIARMQQEALDSLTSAPDGPTRLSTPKDTLQNRLCLLPDQLAVFLNYAKLFAFTMFVLGIAAFRTPPLDNSWIPDQGADKSEPLLPLHSTDHTESTCSAVQSNTATTARKASVREKDNFNDNDPFAPAPGSYPVSLDTDDWGMPSGRQRRALGGTRRTGGRLRVFRDMMLEVAVPVFVVYFWFMWADS